MNHNKGFSLVEVLGVIVILGIIITLVTVAILGYFEGGKDDYNVKLSDQLMIAGKAYFAEHTDLLPTAVSDKAYAYVTVPELQSNNYIEKEFIDSEGRECSPSYVYVKQKNYNPNTDTNNIDSKEYLYIPCLRCQNEAGIKDYSENKVYCNPNLWLDNNLIIAGDVDDTDPEPTPVGGFTCTGTYKNGVTTINATSLYGLSSMYYIVPGETTHHEIALTEEESFNGSIVNKAINGIPKGAYIYLVDTQLNVSEVCDIESEETEVHYSCEYVGGKYYGENGDVVTEAVYRSQCTDPEPEQHICEKYNGKYYGKNGNVVTEAVYKSECTIELPPAPKCKFTSVPTGYTNDIVTIKASCSNTVNISKADDITSKFARTNKHGKITKVTSKKISNKEYEFTITYDPYNKVEATDAIILKAGLVNNSASPKYKNERVVSKDFKVDTKKPVITYSLVDKGTGVYMKTTFCSAYINKGHSHYYGYKSSVKVKETCVDGYSGLSKFTVNGSSVSSPHYNTKSDSGLLTVTSSCKDKAGNEATKTEKYRVLTSHTNCTKCCIKSYKSCPNSTCTCKTYNRCSSCNCESWAYKTVNHYGYKWVKSKVWYNYAGQFPSNETLTCAKGYVGLHKYVGKWTTAGGISTLTLTQYECTSYVSYTTQEKSYCKQRYRCSKCGCQTYNSCVHSSCGVSSCNSCYY